MNNPFYGAMQMRNASPIQMLPRFRQDPVGALSQAGFSIPANVRNPQDIIQHLMNSGQISQAQVNNAQVIARRLGYHF